ncbi:hypothetical protein ZYGR_0AS03570 [Zygosaccharomyces rouxii]|uniref:Probable vacuolar protein sorting-associated protein 16 homolog n=1 Tax=Zygosaccharomyces rouxii TaxID=4956 RepID=A0A1Q3AH12_ZYGRO|nr:hypothetical protein ZYGR_0AS03570 [Zygosaccharomyces rouxii]
MRNPSFNWEKLDKEFFRSRELCDLEWPQKEQVVYSISTTLVAIELDETIQVYNYLGETLASWNSKQFGKVLKIEFDFEDRLLIVTPTTVFRITSWSPLEYDSISLDEKLQDSIWDYKNGAIILKRTQDVYKLKDGTIKEVCKNDGRFTLLTKEHWDCNGKKMILLDVNHTFQLDLRRKNLIQWLTDSEWHRCVISRANKVILYNAKLNKIQVYTESKAPQSEFTVDDIPSAIMWCGNDTVACAFSDEVKLYGSNNSYVTFWYPSEITALRTEVDGLKIFTSERIHFISKIAEPTSSIFRVGSTESGAILFDSLDLLETQTSRALENLNAINLEKAVFDCMDAAREEFSPQLQKKLLNAASFGKASLPYKEFNSDLFVKACDNVRLLNVLRTMGIFVTNEQYKSITFHGIIQGLLMCHKYYQSILLCENLKEHKELLEVFTHWAITKIKISSELDDEELSNLIKKRYAELPKVGYPPMARIAHSAFLEGRFHLARDLTLLESSPELKISELLKLDDDSLTLSECLKFRCPELTSSLLLVMRKKLSTAQLAKLLILDMPQDQLYPYLQRKDHEFLFDYFRQTDSFIELAHLFLAQGNREETLRSFLPQIQELYGRVLNDSLIKQDKELLKKNYKLIDYQEALGNKYHHNFVGLTLNQTIAYLIEIKQERDLGGIIKEFKVNDKKLWHIKCKALVKTKSFDDLYQFAVSKKSPIGYKPFYNYLKRNAHNKEASMYISMISGISYEERKQMYLDCKSYQSAIELAAKEKDVQGLKELHKVIPNNETRLKALIMELMNKL